MGIFCSNVCVQAKFDLALFLTGEERKNFSEVSLVKQSLKNKEDITTVKNPEKMFPRQSTATKKTRTLGKLIP